MRSKIKHPARTQGVKLDDAIRLRLKALPVIIRVGIAGKIADN